MTLRRVLPIVLIGLMLFGATGGALAQDPGPSSPASLQAAYGPGFSYDGRLFSGGAGVSATCDFEFSLWNAASGGAQVGGTHTVNGVIVTAGLLSATAISFTALFTYIHVLDAARACYLAAIADLPASSHNVIFVAARDSCLAMPSAEYAQQFFPEAEIRPGLAKYGSLINSTKAEKLIGFVPEISIKR